VAIAVLNWRERDRTLECLDALGDLVYPRFEVVLVDNGCDDFLSDRPPQLDAVTYVHSDRNLGFSGGCNVALERAHAMGADFVWFLNNDTAPEPDSLTKLVAAAGEAHATVAGAKILRRATEPMRLDSIAVDVDCHGGRFRLVGHDEVDRGQYDQLTAVGAVTGCAMLVRADVAWKLEGFDDRFFLYLEDVDFCLRARAAGEKVIAVPGARVHHARAASRRGRQSDDSLYYTTRNHLLLMARHGCGGASVRFVRTANIIAANVAFAVAGDPHPRRAPARTAAVLAGVRDYFADRFGPRVSRSSPCPDASRRADGDTRR
jgi:GT2 family glycosyltransferase